MSKSPNPKLFESASYENLFQCCPTITFPLTIFPLTKCDEHTEQVKHVPTDGFSSDENEKDAYNIKY